MVTDPLPRKVRSDLGPLPLVIGITGHRDLRPEDEGILTDLIEEFFDTIETQCSHTPIKLLCPLADGADQLVAKVALNRGIEVVAVLPMPEEFYLMDFTAPGRQIFHELLPQTSQRFTLPLAREVTAELLALPPSDGPGDKARKAQYEQLGLYVVHRCQILLALWDGVESGKQGGTACVVNFQQNGIPPKREIPWAPPRKVLDEPGTGPAYVITTPRRERDPRAEKEPFSTWFFPPKGPKRIAAKRKFRFHAHFLRILRRQSNPPETEIKKFALAIESICGPLNGFNQTTVAESFDYDEANDNSLTRLYPAQLAPELSPELRELRRRYAIADSLALKYQENLNGTLITIYILVFLAAVAFASYSHLLTVWGVLAAYLGITAVAWFVVYRNSRLRQDQHKHQDYRALAEGLRVQFFWWLCGQRNSVADYYLRKQKSELDWIRNAIRAWTAPELNGDEPPAAATEDEGRLARLRLVYKYWIEKQADYFPDKVEREHQQLERIELYSRIGFFLGLSVSILLLIGLIRDIPPPHELEEFFKAHHFIEGGVSLTMSMPLVIAALLHSYTEKKALSEHIKQYGRMGEVFSRAQKYLEPLLTVPAHGITAEELEDADGVIHELGVEALAENADWVILHRERPVDPPHAA
jgi:hypothetical protein